MDGSRGAFRLAVVLAHAAQLVGAANSRASLTANVSYAGTARVACPTNCRMRLTSDNPGQLGAAWSKNLFPVTDGFETTFQFQFTDKSSSCATQHMWTEFCSTRGGNGIAFVIYGEDDRQQAERDLTKLLGRAGGDDAGLGYEGLRNSVVVEFDMLFDRDRQDLFENHIGVMTRGYTELVSANHKYSLGSTAAVPEFGYARVHTARIRYEPVLNPDDILHNTWCIKRRSCRAYQQQPYFSELITKGFFPEGKYGTLWVYIDDMRFPRLIVPMRLSTVLDLVNPGKARFGFTSTTSPQNWQKHEVFNWTVCTGANNTLCSQF